MKKFAAMLLTVAMTLSLCACGGSKTEVSAGGTLSWQEQYDLGVRYLSEGNYEEAIIAFTAAIEIDPKQADSYLKAAEAYEAMGDIENAVAMLEQGVNATQDVALQEKLDALQQFANVPAIPEMLALEFEDGLRYTNFWPEYYTELPEEAIRVFEDIITAGLAEDQDYLLSNIISERLRDTVIAYCAPDEYHERDDGGSVRIWTTAGDAWLSYYHQIYEDHIWIELDYRPETGTAFSYTYDFHPNNIGFNYAVGYVEGYLFNGPFSKYSVHEWTDEYGYSREDRKHTGTAVNELIHGEYICEYRRTSEYDTYQDNYTGYTTYENGYIQPCWQDDDENIVTSKSVYLDGEVRYWDYNDEAKAKLQPVLRTW